MAEADEFGNIGSLLLVLPRARDVAIARDTVQQLGLGLVVDTVTPTIAAANSLSI